MGLMTKNGDIEGHEKTEKEISEDEETSSSRNTCDDSVSPCSSIQRNEVDAEPKALTHSKGTEARTRAIQEHLQSEAHKECLEAERLKKLSSVEKSQTVPLVKMLSSQRQKLANKIGIEIGSSDTVGFDEVMKVITHLSTDGEDKNVGEHRGLWKLLDDNQRKLDIDTPLLKSVCAVHSTANAYKDLCKSVPEIDHLVKKIAAIFYLFSRFKRTSELEKVANVEGLTVRRFPKYFEVRWAEFTAALLDAILCSWQALIKFNVEQCDAEGKKPAFLNQSVPKKLQSDSLTIVDIEPEAEKFRERVNKLSTGSLLGGSENEYVLRDQASGEGKTPTRCQSVCNRSQKV
eukprot:gene16990-8493_t